jgi:hypothetical protein
MRLQMRVQWISILSTAFVVLPHRSRCGLRSLPVYCARVWSPLHTTR